jgi:CheY-like chemotaxis protein
MVRRLVIRTLQAADRHILEAESGNAALARLDAGELGQVHLLITDIVMPGTTGVEVARRFRARYPSLPVLFMSGYADEIFAHRGVNELGGGFLAKPFSPAALRTAVENALRE